MPSTLARGQDWSKLHPAGVVALDDLRFPKITEHMLVTEQNCSIPSQPTSSPPLDAQKSVYLMLNDFRQNRSLTFYNQP
jgi:hypothetical protein